MSYFKVVNYLLAANATDDIIATAGMDIMTFKQPVAWEANEYINTLWMKALRCRPVYKEYHPEASFLEEVIK